MGTFESDRDEVVEVVTEALNGLGLDPRLIPHGSINELRGGLRCLDLAAGDCIDAALLGSRTYYSSPSGDDSRTRYRVDYAVRGTIKGILNGRIISRSVPEQRGLLRRRLTGVKWVVPSSPSGGNQGYLSVGTESPPGPGEVWEGGPHETLTAQLNEDVELVERLRAFADRGRGRPLSLSIVSDRWGESIRIRGDIWLDAHDLISTYVTPKYMEIIDRVGGHLREIRRSFGGLAF